MDDLDRCAPFGTVGRNPAKYRRHMAGRRGWMAALPAVFWLSIGMFVLALVGAIVVPHDRVLFLLLALWTLSWSIPVIRSRRRKDD